MSIFCRHDWKILSDTTTKSKFEIAVETIKSSVSKDKVKLPWQLCDGERKHIQIVSCSRCGKLKRFVEKI
jgi:hypothetical protein